MLRMSNLTDYSIRIMDFLSCQPERAYSAKAIAALVDLEPPTISKLLKRLLKANLVISYRGAQGGYQLAKAPEAITLAEIVLAIEGDPSLTRCSHDDGHCAHEPHCSVRDGLRAVNRSIVAMLENTRLTDLSHTHEVNA